jgi:lysylphosphatidylglycerol synthetase-like protein (DUF2156 family)
MTDRTIGARSKSMQWSWVIVGVLIGGVLIAVFLNAVDRYLDRPAEDALVISLCVLLVGILVGGLSKGEALREAAVAGLMLSVLTLAIVAFQMRVQVSTLVWLTGPFYAMVLALMGGYVGEMLQGTLEEAHVDKAVDWPWVFVSIIVGFTVSTYSLFLLRALMPADAGSDLYIFAGAFVLTGLIIGFFSPGKTMVEPAIAAAGMILAHSGFVLLYIDPPPAIDSLLFVFAGGTLLALLGGWLGEMLQTAVGR